MKIKDRLRMENVGWELREEIKKVDRKGEWEGPEMMRTG